jgi:osmotically-inducible protein OsmY
MKKRVLKLTSAPMFLAATAGALGQFFLDRQQGARRRNVARDRVAGFFRRRSREVARKARYAEGVAEGAAYKAGLRPQAERDREQPDDLTLARKVETELFRDADVPKGDININAENGVVYLRGQVKQPGQIEELVKAARKVEGVKDVESLLHLPKTPAPTKSGKEKVGAQATK